MNKNEEIKNLDINPYGIPVCENIGSMIVTQKVIDYRGTAIVEDSEIKIDENGKITLKI